VSRGSERLAPLRELGQASVQQSGSPLVACSRLQYECMSPLSIIGGLGGAELAEHMLLSHDAHCGFAHMPCIWVICAVVGWEFGWASMVAKFVRKVASAQRQFHMAGSLPPLAKIIRWHDGMQYTSRSSSVKGGLVPPKTWPA
jgi:hypothetical protein